MSVLENSFTSERDSPNRAKSHSLCQELQQLDVKSQYINTQTPKPDTNLQEDINNSYIEPNSNNKLDSEPELQQISKIQDHKEIEDNKMEEQFSKIQELKQTHKADPEIELSDIASKNKLDEDIDVEEQGNCSSESPKTITLIQQDIISRDSINMSSKISQYSSEVDNQSFATFLSIRDNSYSTMVKYFEVLFSNVYNLFGERMKNIAQTYLSYIKIKYNQEKSYQSVSLRHTQNSKNHIIYIDCKTIADKIHAKIQQQKQKHSVYLKSLQVLYSKLQKHLQNNLVNLQLKQSKIQELLKKIDDIVNQMNDLMIPQHRKKNKRSINPQIYSCSFIRTKYLMNKEKTYLTCIANYLQSVLSFVSFICLDLEPKNCLIVKQCMIGYAEALGAFSPANSENLQKSIQVLSKTNCFHETYDEVSNLLELCIPDQIRPNYCPTSAENSQRKLKKLIEGLISESQSLVYIPVIELEGKDYAYHSKNKADVKWIKINYERKYKEESIQEHETYVILTHQGDLVLELLDTEDRSEEKMAILKLKNLKLSRKNNKVFLNDKGAGMLGYLFSSDAVLGSLVFQPLHKTSDPTQVSSNIVDEFIQRVKQIMQDKKQREKEKPKDKDKGEQKKGGKK